MDEEKKISQEEARLAAAAKKFLRQISVSTKNFRTFGESHPFLKGNVKAACELLGEMLLLKDSVTFTFMEGSCLVEEIPLKDLDIKSFSFLATARECGLTSLTFMRGLADSDLHTLLKIISGGPNAIKSESGLGAYLRRKNISNIKADEIFFKKVSEKEEDAREAKKHLEDFLIMNYLLGKSAISRDDINSLVVETTENPKHIGKLLSAAVNAAKASGDAGFACAGLEKLATHIRNVEGVSYDDVKARMGNLIMALEPSVRSDVLKSRIPIAADASGNMVEDIIKEFSNEAITELIVSDVVDRESSVMQARKLISRLLATQTKRKQLFGHIEDRLSKKGVSKKVCDELLKEPFWHDMTAAEKCAKALVEKPQFCVDMGISDEMAGLVESLAGEKKFSDAEKVIDKVLDNFHGADDELKSHLTKEVGKLGRMCMEKQLYEPLSKILGACRFDAVRADIFGNTDLAEFFNGLIADERMERHIPLILAQAIGDDAAAALEKIAASVTSDDFDSYKKRRIIERILKNVKPS